MLVEPTTSAPAPAPVLAAPNLQESFLPLPSDSTTLSIESGTSLRSLVEQMGTLTGVLFRSDAETWGMLESLPCGLDRATQVESGDAWRFVNDLLLSNGMHLTGLRTDGPYLLEILSQHNRSNSFARTRAVLVDVDALPSLSDYSAMIVETQVSFEAADARQVSNSLRSLISDHNSSMMLPVGDTNSVMVTGPLNQVQRITTIMREADRGLVQLRAAQSAGANQQGE
jgi:hypothetical protein